MTHKMSKGYEETFKSKIALLPPEELFKEFREKFREIYGFRNDTVSSFIHEELELLSSEIIRRMENR